MINLWDYWDREWNRAKAFFKSKGNTKTLSRLKDKWNKELFIDFKKIGKDSWDSALKEAKKKLKMAILTNSSYKFTSSDLVNTGIKKSILIIEGLLKK